MKSDNQRASQNKAITQALSSVGSTVEVYADRMKRKLKEQETLLDESRKASSVRQARMLQGLTTIRKALVETSRIDLGGRFQFELKVSDWEGWPRLDLNLVDKNRLDVVVEALTVVAHDREDLGLIQMTLKSGENAGRVVLSEPGEFEKLPVVLKRSIRHFLDAVTPFILNQVNPTQVITPADKEVSVPTGTEVATQKALSKMDLFGEELLPDDNTVKATDVNPLDV